MKTLISEADRTRLLDVYNNAVDSFVMRHIRTLNAQIAYYKTSLALYEFT